MSWRKNFICSINLESGSFLSNETVDELFGCVRFEKEFPLDVNSGTLASSASGQVDFFGNSLHKPFDV